MICAAFVVAGFLVSLAISILVGVGIACGGKDTEGY